MNNHQKKLLAEKLGYKIDYTQPDTYEFWVITPDKAFPCDDWEPDSKDVMYQINDLDKFYDFLCGEYGLPLTESEMQGLVNYVCRNSEKIELPHVSD